MANIPAFKEQDVNAGMPILAISKKISRYEFMPTWVWYTPVFISSLWQGIKRFDLRLPLMANPGIKLSGMVGESKTDILNLAGKIAQAKISPYITFTKQDDDLDKLLLTIEQGVASKNITLPFVIKPDEGCHGTAVKVMHTTAEIREYLTNFPLATKFMIQEKIKYPAEAGVFYIRYPDKEHGEIISLTLKYKPFVVGDGVKTLRELIKADERAGKLEHIYFPKHKDKLEMVLPKGEQFSLAFAGNHISGAVFKNGAQFITKELTEALDVVLKDVQGFYFGRLDIKFKDINTFIKGEDFTIIEINGATSESIHIWDNTAKPKEIFGALLYQYKVLFEIGYAQKKRGVKPPKIMELYREWRRDKALMKKYPLGD